MLLAMKFILSKQVSDGCCNTYLSVPSYTFWCMYGDKVTGLFDNVILFTTSSIQCANNHVIEFSESNWYIFYVDIQ